MSDPIYPYPALPRPTQNYGASVDPKLAVTQFEIGRRQRPRFSATDEVVSVSWGMTQLQLDAFRYFVTNVLEQGSKAFTIGIIGIDGIQTRTVQLAGGTFTQRYVPHQRYTVSATLITSLASSLMTGADYDVLLIQELSDPNLFYITASSLHDYIENHYGEPYTI
jgi:hypothetical protein